MKNPSPEVTFWFENVKYGEMFDAANNARGIVTSTFPPFPQPFQIPGVEEVKRAYGRGAALGIVAGVINLLWAGWFATSPIETVFFLGVIFSILVGGILTIIGGLLAYRVNHKKGGVLIIIGGLLDTPSFIGLLSAITGGWLCLRGKKYKVRRFTKKKACPACNKSILESSSYAHNAVTNSL